MVMQLQLHNAHSSPKESTHQHHQPARVVLVSLDWASIVKLQYRSRSFHPSRSSTVLEPRNLVGGSAII